MAGYIIGFLCFVAFVVLVGVLALIFISFDGPSDAKPGPIQRITGHFPAVRRINTTTIETVDQSGTVQQWQRLG
ncbi:MAG: hypothetical protein CL607_09800 [Anaerolineaceae bacterium]|nr:hypothetical protein [Anaerolineaceae bacterium]